MLGRYHQILEDVRSPERVIALGRLIETLLENNYADDLVGIEDIVAVNDGQVEAAINCEALIVNCTYTLLNKLGIEISIDNINRVPSDVADILDAILDSVDYFDDYDTMLQIMTGEENSVEAIGCLTGFVTGSQDHKYIEIINNVSKRTVRVIKNTLTTRAVATLDQNKDTDLELVAQLCQFIKTYPSSPIVPLLKNYGYLSSEHQIADGLEVDHSGDVTVDYATSLAGILYTHNKSFEDAYDALEELAEYMIGDDMSVNQSQLMLKASDMLDGLFKNQGVDNE